MGESYFERVSSVKTLSRRIENKENNDFVTSGNNTGQSNGNSVLQVTNFLSSSISPVSVAPASMMDHASKDSLLLTELLDSSDDEWANTSAFDSDTGEKTSASTGLSSSSSRFKKVESTPCSQQRVVALSFQGQSAIPNKKCNNLNSTVSPQRVNPIPNNGNDSK